MKREVPVMRLPHFILLASACLLAACGDKGAGASGPATVAALELAPADVAIVTRGVLAAGLPLTGALQPVNQTTVQARVASDIGQVLVREGESVKQGQLLVRLGTQDLDARLKQAQANLASAKVQAQLSRALADRYRQLFEKHLYSEVDYQKSVGEADAREEEVRAQQALVDIARKAFDDANVKAPMSGIIARRYVEPGSSVGMDARLFDIVDLHEMELAASVPSADIAAVHVGQRVTFTTTGAGQRSFDGRVVRINPVADAGTRAITVYVRVQNPDGALRGGMFARGAVVSGAATPVLIVPLPAVRRDAGQAGIFVLRGGKLELRRVTLGIVDERDGQAEVKDGVKEGETVVLVSLEPQAAGSTAKVVNVGR